MLRIKDILSKNGLKKIILIPKIFFCIKTPLSLLKGRLLTQDKEYIIEFYNGMKLYSPDHLGCVTLGILSIEDTYFIKNIKKENIKSIIDVGSNTGVFGAMMSYIFPNSKIIFIEPAEENIKSIKKQISINEIQSYGLFKGILSDTTGKKDLFLSSSVTHSVIDNRTNNKEKITVESIDLNDLMIKYNMPNIDLLKMDIEGGEYAIFENKKSIKLINSYVKFIAMEYHNIDEKMNLSLIIKILDNFIIWKHNKETENTGILLLKNKYVK